MKPAHTAATTSQQQKPLDEKFQQEVDRIVQTALNEDLGSPASYIDGDITSISTVQANLPAKAQLIVKTEGVLAGLDIAARVFRLVDPSSEFTVEHAEGSYISTVPQVVARISGSARGLLVAERTALNLLQRLCGIATLTRQFTEKAGPHGIAILDTRKTTPGLRTLEKYAVTVGGGTNHRYGLFDAILIKDNHISIAGGLRQAIRKSRAHFPDKPVEVEVASFDELAQALEEGAEKIMLDNMSPAQVAEACKIVAGKAFIEVSGGINLANIESYLIAGVDAISIGALTHSVDSLDISLEIED